MREITTHKVNGCNEAITVEAMDGPGPGGAPHEYRLSHPGPVGPNNPSDVPSFTYLNFQNGPVAEALTKLEEAMHWLHSRTRARVTRGVEGTMAK